jgi:hypothetical protein
LICDNCLITGFAKRKATIDYDIVKEVVDDLPLPSNVMLQEEPSETPVQRTSVLAHLADTDSSYDERPEPPVEAPVKAQAKGLKSLLPESSVESQSYQEPPRPTTREAAATREAFDYQQRQNKQQSRLEEPVRAEHSPPPPRVVIQKAKVPWLGFLLIAVLSAFLAFAAAYMLLGKGKESNAVASTDTGTKQQSMTDQIKQAIDNSQSNMRAGQVDNPARQMPEESTIGLTEYHNTSADQYLSPQDRYNHLDTPRPMVNEQNQQLTYNVNAVIDSPKNADDIRRKWGFDTESGEVTTRPEVRSNSAPIPQPMIESQPVSAMQVDNSSSAVNRQAAQDDKVSSPVEIMISRPQDKRRMPNGGTISQLARSKYSTWNDTVRDIVITANPELGGDLNLLRAHQEVVLPTISRDDLVVRSQNGYWYVFVGSYISKSRAMQQQQRLYSAGDVSVAQLSDSYGQNIYRLFLGPYDGLAHAVNRARLYEFEEMPFVR